MGESVPKNRECWIPKHSRGVLNAENLSKSDRTSGERYTPALAIPTANVERVREVMRSAMLTAHQHNKSFCFGDFATCHNCKDWREALALLEPHT